MNYRYLERKVALQQLPRSASDLIRNPNGFVVYDQEKFEWVDASWAQELYAKDVKA
jgi:hypothetical protein